MANYIEKLILHYPELEPVCPQIEQAVDGIVKMHKAQGKLLICGNGGSAADSDHISGELLKGFLLKRPVPAEQRRLFEGEMREHIDELQQGICAIPLPQLAAAISAYSNDVAGNTVYAQLVYATGRGNDVFLGLSTSGNSENVVLAAETAKALGLVTICLTGERGGKLAQICDIAVKVPDTETYRIQEYHLPVYHAICAEAEARLFGK